MEVTFVYPGKVQLYGSPSGDIEFQRDRIVDAPEGEVLVRQATNDEKWGPKGSLMLQIADMTFQFQHLTAITQTLWARLSDDRGGKAWRTVYKGLLLLDYVLKNGSEQFVNDARHHSRILNGLSRFHYVDTEGVDRGVSVRERANIVMELMHDTKRLRDERKKAKANRGKFSQSISNQYGGFGNSPGAFQGGGGGGMSGYGGFGRDSPQWSTNPDADVFGDSSDDDLAPSSSSKSKPKRKGGDDDEWDPFSEDSSSAKKTSRDPAFAAPASTKSQATNDDDEWASFVGSSSTAATTKSAAPPPASTAPPVDLLGALNLEPTAPSGGNPLSAFSNPSTPAASANASSAPMLGGLLAPTPSSPSPATGGSGLLGASSPAKPTTSLNPTDPFDFGFGTSTTTTPTTSSKPLSSVTPAANYNVPVGTFGGAPTQYGASPYTASATPMSYGAQPAYPAYGYGQPMYPHQPSQQPPSYY